MEFTGKIIYKWPRETVGQNALEKVSVVLEEVSDKDYKSSIMVEFFKDKIGLIEHVNQGALVKVQLNPRAREYNGRRYNSISCRKLDTIEWGSAGGVAPQTADDELPF